MPPWQVSRGARRSVSESPSPKGFFTPDTCTFIYRSVITSGLAAVGMISVWIWQQGRDLVFLMHDLPVTIAEVNKTLDDHDKRLAEHDKRISEDDRQIADDNRRIAELRDHERSIEDRARIIERRLISLEAISSRNYLRRIPQSEPDRPWEKSSK